MRILIVLMGMMACAVSTCAADGNAVPNEWSDTSAQVSSTGAAHADPPLDPRLPPLLPGEPVTRGGKKMNMWSTSGPVPVNKAPEPFEDKHSINTDHVDVIVDQRDDHHRSR